MFLPVALYPKSQTSPSSPSIRSVRYLYRKKSSPDNGYRNPCAPMRSSLNVPPYPRSNPENGPRLAIRSSVMV